MKISSLTRYAEFWYSGYAFQAAVVFGTGAILMPIIVNKAGNAALAGTVIAFLYLGQMTAPLIGTITDRTGMHRLFYLVGYVLLAIGLGLFPLTNLLWFWMALAFIQGVGYGSTNTVASMFIVEYKPKPEWDQRIGVLQTFYGMGLCAGLVLVSYLQSSPELGLLVSAGLMLPGIILGSIHLPPSRKHNKPDQVEFERRRHKPQRTCISLLCKYEAPAWQVVQKMRKEWFSTFGLFLLGWFFVMLATWLLGTLYPLLMKDALHVSYHLSSLYYAIGAAIGIFAYSPSGALGKKIGDGWVMAIGIVMTLVSFAGLTFLAYVDTGMNTWLVPLFYVLIPIAWPPLIVGGTAWAAQLATVKEGEALGLFNATSSVSSVISAFAAGLIGHNLGFGSILVVATISSALALVCILGLVSTKRGSTVKTAET